MRHPFLTLAAAVGLALAGGAPGNTRPASPAGAPSVQRWRVPAKGENLKPCVLAAPRGGAYLAWAGRQEERTSILFASSADGLAYGPAVRVSTDAMDLDLGAESGPQGAVGPDGAIYLVWVAGSWKAPAPAMQHKMPAAGGSGKSGPPPRPGNLNVYLVSSRDGGKTFSAPVKVNDDPDGVEHRFGTVAVDGRGRVYVAWLDKRKQNAERPDFARVFVTHSDDGGRTFAPNVDATAGQGNGICHCCKVALAADPQGKVSIAFRNDVDNMRDVFMVRSAEGHEFSPPAAIEDIRWMINACPFNGPSLGWDAAKRLHAVWMTGGSVSGSPLVGRAAGDRYKVLYRRTDGAAAWGPLRVVAEGAHPRMAVLPTGAAWLAWEKEGLQAVRMEPSGQPGPRLRLTAPEASAAFPSLAAASDGALLAAWQQRGPDDNWQVWAGKVTSENRPGAPSSGAAARR